MIGDLNTGGPRDLEKGGAPFFGAQLFEDLTKKAGLTDLSNPASSTSESTTNRAVEAVNRAAGDSSPFARPRLGPKAKIPNHDGTRLRFARDSPLEQAGFELPVPLATVSL